MRPDRERARNCGWELEKEYLHSPGTDGTSCRSKRGSSRKLESRLQVSHMRRQSLREWWVAEGRGRERWVDQAAYIKMGQKKWFKINWAILKVGQS